MLHYKPAINYLKKHSLVNSLVSLIIKVKNATAKYLTCELKIYVNLQSNISRVHDNLKGKE